MGNKRTSSGVKVEATKQLKREPTPDSDEEEDYVEDTDVTGTDETKVESSATTYEPDDLRSLVESFLEFLGSQSHIPTVQNMEKLVTEWVESRPDDMIDAGAFRADFRKYLRTAITHKNFQLNDAAATLHTFLSGEKALTEFKDFPGKVPNRVGEYIKRKGLHVKIGGLSKVFQTMRDDTSGIVEQIDEDIQAKMQSSVPDMRKFLDEHPNLTDVQRNAIQLKIKRIEKPRNGASGTPRKRAKKEPETAYSIWCRTMTDKYRDMSEDEREKKLQKKFAKLPEGQRTLLESLALVH